MNTTDVKELPAARCLLYADGIAEKDIDRPFIAVVNSFNEITTSMPPPASTSPASS
jgi:dihydroxyacid dehydratase/phosphogluconate dehydratase